MQDGLNSESRRVHETCSMNQPISIHVKNKNNFQIRNTSQRKFPTTRIYLFIFFFSTHRRTRGCRRRIIETRGYLQICMDSMKILPGSPLRRIIKVINPFSSMAGISTKTRNPFLQCLIGNNSSLRRINIAGPLPQVLADGTGRRIVSEVPRAISVGPTLIMISFLTGFCTLAARHSVIKISL